VEKRVLNRIFVDTLFVVALVNPNDKHHKKALSLAKKYEDHPLLVTDAILLEIGNGLARNFKKQAIEIIDHFFVSDEVEIVYLSPELFQRGFTFYKKHKDKEWGLIDCISFEVMRENGINDALTFDRHFLQSGCSRRQIAAIDPLSWAAMETSCQLQEPFAMNYW
jgi:hypothetical protein